MKNLTKKIISASAFFLFSARGVFAESLDDVRDPVAARFPDVGTILTNAFVYVLVIAGMVSILVIVWGGFRYMTAQGDEKAIAAARNIIVGAVIGLVIILSLGVIAGLIQTVFKINLFGVTDSTL